MLPQVETLAIGGSASMPHSVFRPEHPIRVLLVEDDEDDYLIARDLLSSSAQFQYKIHWVSKYNDGLEHLRHSEVDACIIDYRIGGRTGLEFVQEALTAGATVPIILLTGVGDPDIDLAATRVGAADYLDKSELSGKLLERSIRYALRHNQTVAALKEATQRIEQAKLELEAKVLQRTQELSIANETLKKEIEERERVESQLRNHAFYDRLTGLPNRALLVDRIDHAIQRCRRSADKSFALLLINLDRFQTVNDALGHAAGDELLVIVARRLTTLSRHEDVVARIGGNEFAWFIADVPAEVVPDCAERIRGVLAEPIEIDAQKVYCTASIGFTLGIHGYFRAENMLHDASLALHSAKCRGKDRSEIFKVGMRANTGGRLALESGLRAALQSDDAFELYYQPIVASRSGASAGLEALIRWRHAERGLVGPGEFMPIAEETGLVVPLGRLILDQAGRAIKEWCSKSLLDCSLFLSVNISPRQLMDSSLVDDVRNFLEWTRAPASCLKLEITESTLMADPQLACDVLTRIKNLGVGLSIDDFGTGYSSLSYLRRFPFDVVKIDRSLVRSMRNSAEDKAVVETIVRLADVLGMDVIAEGVESIADIECLDDIGCGLMQGFYFAAPLPRKDAEAWLRRERAERTERSSWHPHQGPPNADRTVVAL